jgi:hypothetical protein
MKKLVESSDPPHRLIWTPAPDRVEVPSTTTPSAHKNQIGGSDHMITSSAPLQPHAYAGQG